MTTSINSIVSANASSGLYYQHVGSSFYVAPADGEEVMMFHEHHDNPLTWGVCVAPRPVGWTLLPEASGYHAIYKEMIDRAFAGPDGNVHYWTEDGCCPDCGRSSQSSIPSTCCPTCGASCNLQAGCGSDYCTHAPEGCDAGNHEYSDFACPKCAHLCCWGCSVRCTNDSTGEGAFTCPSCGHNDHYPEIMKEDRAGDHCSQKTGCPHLGKPELGCCTPIITDELIEWAKDRTGRAPAWNCPFYTGNDPV